MTERGRIGSPAGPNAGRVLDGPTVHREGVEQLAHDRVVRVHPVSKLDGEVCPGWTPGRSSSDRRARFGCPTGVHRDRADSPLAKVERRPGQACESRTAAEVHARSRTLSRPDPSTSQAGSAADNPGQNDYAKRPVTGTHDHQKINQQHNDKTTQQTSYETSNYHYPSQQVTRTTAESQYKDQLRTRSNGAHQCTTVRWGCAAASGGRDHPGHPNTPLSPVDLVCEGLGAGGGWSRWC